MSVPPAVFFTSTRKGRPPAPSAEKPGGREVRSSGTESRTVSGVEDGGSRDAQRVGLPGRGPGVIPAAFGSLQCGRAGKSGAEHKESEKSISELHEASLSG